MDPYRAEGILKAMENVNYTLMYENERTHWWYRVRRLLVRYLIGRYAGVKSPRILDVGCGTGLLMKELQPLCDVHGIDVSPIAVDFCRARGIANVSQSDGESIPFPADSFDVVLALDVIEHIADDRAATAELHRVLKPGGIAIIFVPAFRFLWGITDELSRHYRRYTLPELRRLFPPADYTVIRSSYFNTFLFLPILAVRGFVRLFKLRVQSEFKANNPLLNAVLFQIFYLEYSLLKRVSFPFGVSALIVARKNI